MTVDERTVGACPGGSADAREAALGLEATIAGQELPDAASCARLAAAWEEAGDADAAARWAVRAVDGGVDFTAWRAAVRVLDRVLPGSAPSLVRTLRLGVLATSTATPLLPCLRLALAREGIAVELYEAPYGQYWQEVLDPRSGLRSFGPDVVVLLPDHHALGGDAMVDDPEAWVGAELERFTGLWEQVAGWGVDIVQVSLVEPLHDPLGSLAAGIPGSRRARIRELNRRFAEQAAEAHVGFVDAEAIAAGVGKRRWFDGRYWHAAKHAVAMAAVPDLARGITATLVARIGRSRKCLVLDLDNTLWGGVIGDDGLDGIVLGGTRGEAYVDVQRAIAELADRGIVLAVCSKNDAATAREPFEQHPDMVLSLDQIAVFESSWATKPEGLRRISEQLGLGLDAMVLVDDNPVEREDVRRMLPEVDVVVLPPDPAAWPDALTGHRRLEPGSLTDEDRRRTGQYRARAQAADLQRSARSLEEFQASLAMTAIVEPLGDLNLDRVAQLIAKTNQFNLTTRRHGAERIRAIAADPGWAGWAFRLADRFADHGLVAVALAAEVDGALDVDTFVMSCRVIGRGLEHVVMEVVVEEARRRSLDRVQAQYLPTARNGLVADLWPRLGLQELERRDGGALTYELRDLDAAVVRSQIAVEQRTP